MIFDDSYFRTLALDLLPGLFVDILVFLFVVVGTPFMLFTLFANCLLPVFNYDDIFHVLVYKRFGVG